MKLKESACDRRLNDWNDWKLDFLECCSVLADTQALRDELEKLLSHIVMSKGADSWQDSYMVEHVKLLRFGMIEKYDGTERASEFIEQNLQHAAFRKIAIENAMSRRDYNSVERLALEGEALDSDKRGLMTQWMEYRFTTYKITGNLEKLRILATRFILNGSFEYYMTLKDTYLANEWLSVYPQIIVQLENQKNTDRGIYTRILIEEKEKLKLFDFVKTRPSSIETYYIHLIPDFEEEVFQLFVQYIEHAAAGARDRNGYHRVCSIIRNLKKAGGKEAAMKVKQKLLMTYNNKPAFKDELSRV